MKFWRLILGAFLGMVFFMIIFIAELIRFESYKEFQSISFSLSKSLVLENEKIQKNAILYDGTWIYASPESTINFPTGKTKEITNGEILIDFSALDFSIEKETELREFLVNGWEDKDAVPNMIKVFNQASIVSSGEIFIKKSDKQTLVITKKSPAFILSEKIKTPLVIPPWHSVQLNERTLYSIGREKGIEKKMNIFRQKELSNSDKTFSDDKYKKEAQSLLKTWHKNLLKYHQSAFDNWLYFQEKNFIRSLGLFILQTQEDVGIKNSIEKGEKIKFNKFILPAIDAIHFFEKNQKGKSEEKINEFKKQSIDSLSPFWLENWKRWEISNIFATKRLQDENTYKFYRSFSPKNNQDPYQQVSNLINDLYKAKNQNNTKKITEIITEFKTNYTQKYNWKEVPQWKIWQLENLITNILIDNPSLRTEDVFLFYRKFIQFILNLEGFGNDYAYEIFHNNLKLFSIFLGSFSGLDVQKILFSVHVSFDTFKFEEFLSRNDRKIISIIKNVGDSGLSQEKSLAITKQGEITENILREIDVFKRKNTENSDEIIFEKDLLALFKGYGINASNSKNNLRTINDFIVFKNFMYQKKITIDGIFDTKRQQFKLLKIAEQKNKSVSIFQLDNFLQDAKNRATKKEIEDKKASTRKSVNTEKIDQNSLLSLLERKRILAFMENEDYNLKLKDIMILDENMKLFSIKSAIKNKINLSFKFDFTNRIVKNVKIKGRNKFKKLSWEKLQTWINKQD